MNQEPLLRSGLQASEALEKVRAVLADGPNVVARAGTPSITWFDRLRNEYGTWAQTLENTLRTYFAAPAVWEPITQSPRWAEIRHLDRTTLRPSELVAVEVQSQCDRVNDILDHLEASLVHFELADGVMAVMPDTNVFLHYTYFKELDWLGYIKQMEASVTHVRLVVPSIVLSELDDQSYKSLPRADRAKSVEKGLRQLLDIAAPEAPAAVTTSLDVQFLIDAPGHIPRQNADDELLTRAEYLASLVGDRVCVATGDLGMQTRALVRGLGCLVLPMEERIPRDRQ